MAHLPHRRTLASPDPNPISTPMDPTSRKQHPSSFTTNHRHKHPNPTIQNITNHFSNLQLHSSLKPSSNFQEPKSKSDTSTTSFTKSRSLNRRNPSDFHRNAEVKKYSVFIEEEQSIKREVIKTEEFKKIQESDGDVKRSEIIKTGDFKKIKECDFDVKRSNFSVPMVVVGSDISTTSLTKSRSLNRRNLSDFQRNVEVKKHSAFNEEEQSIKREVIKTEEFKKIQESDGVVKRSEIIKTGDFKNIKECDFDVKRSNFYVPVVGSDISTTSLTKSRSLNRRNVSDFHRNVEVKKLTVSHEEKQSIKREVIKTEEFKKIQESDADVMRSEMIKTGEFKKIKESDVDVKRSPMVVVGCDRRRSFGCTKTELGDFFSRNGVKVVSVDMPPFMQIHAVDFARKACDSLEKFTARTLASTLKKEFDGVYGPAWHCIVGTSFGSFVTHSVGGFLYFSMDHKLYVLLFKTTVQRAH